MKQKINTLAVGFICPAGVVVGQPVKISDDLTVAALDAAGEVGIVGNVAVHLALALSCTVETRFRERRDDRIAAAATAVGPFVWDADMKVIPYTKQQIASVTGTEDDATFEVIEGSNDKFKVTIGSGGAQTFTLTPGSARTMDQIVADFAAATGFVASKSSGKLKLTATQDNVNIIIGTVTNDAYTLLGFTVGTYVGASSHDPASIAGLVIKGTLPLVVTGGVLGPFDIANNTNDALKLKVGSGASQTFDLTTGNDQTADDIANKINLTATGFTASGVNGYVVFTLDDPATDLEVEAVANDAYDTIGLVVGVYSAPMTVETLEK